MRFKSLLLVATLLSAGLAARADVLTYTYSGNFSGVLGGTTFTNASTTFTETANTSGLVPVFSGVLNPGTVSVNVAGVGTATFLSSTAGAFTEPLGGVQLVAIFDPNSGFGLGLENPTIPLGYGLTTALGPVSGLYFPNNPIAIEPTTLGSLLITTQPNTIQVSFTAVAATPEPSSFALLGTGLLGFAGALRRRLA